ncbi:hypothetical protein GF324_02175 [bacterium]|nr:hypothetical protein [bacterium]
MIRTRDEWLYENVPAGKHIRDLYRIIKSDRFDQWFKSRILTKQQVENRLRRGPLFRKTGLLLYREFFQAVHKEE